MDVEMKSSMGGGLMGLWFPLVFAGLWIVIGLALSRFGGWHDLAKEYRSDRDLAAGRLRWKSAGMRGMVRYRNCLSMGSDGAGFFLSISPLFRAGHPSLFIPWSDISVSPRRVWIWDFAELRFARCPGIPLLIRAALAKSLLANGPLRLVSA
jgi:hypothetical protein